MWRMQVTTKVKWQTITSKTINKSHLKLQIKQRKNLK